jgi:hypothetical protein
LFTRYCYECLEAADQQDVINHIATYVMALITRLELVKAKRNKAERDSDNHLLDKDTPLVLPA